MSPPSQDITVILELVTPSLQLSPVGIINGQVESQDFFLISFKDHEHKENT
jgi:hypothetical protein